VEIKFITDKKIFKSLNTTPRQLNGLVSSVELYKLYFWNKINPDFAAQLDRSQPGCKVEDAAKSDSEYIKKFLDNPAYLDSLKE
jgi:hypothetical protein